MGRSAPTRAQIGSTTKSSSAVPKAVPMSFGRLPAEVQTCPRVGEVCRQNSQDHCDGVCGLLDLWQFCKDRRRGLCEIRRRGEVLAAGLLLMCTAGLCDRHSEGPVASVGDTGGGEPCDVHDSGCGLPEPWLFSELRRRRGLWMDGGMPEPLPAIGLTLMSTAGLLRACLSKA